METARTLCAPRPACVGPSAAGGSSGTRARGPSQVRTLPSRWGGARARGAREAPARGQRARAAGSCGVKARGLDAEARARLARAAGARRSWARGPTSGSKHAAAAVRDRHRGRGVPGQVWKSAPGHAENWAPDRDRARARAALRRLADSARQGTGAAPLERTGPLGRLPGTGLSRRLPARAQRSSRPGTRAPRHEARHTSPARRHDGRGC